MIKDGDDDGDLDDGDDEQEANEVRESDAARVMEFNEELKDSFQMTMFFEVGVPSFISLKEERQERIF